MSSTAETPIAFRSVRVVLPDGSSFQHITFGEFYEIRVPAFHPVLGPGYVSLRRHEAFGMIWFEEAKWA